MTYYKLWSFILVFVFLQLVSVSNAQWLTSGNNIYYNNGNVGIGTSNPLSKLDVNGNIFMYNGLLQLYQTYENYANVLNFKTVDDNNFGDFKFYAQMTDPDPDLEKKLFAILGTSGYVGIGTHNPSTILHAVKESGNSLATIETQDNNALAGIDIKGGISSSISFNSLTTPNLGKIEYSNSSQTFDFFNLSQKRLSLTNNGVNVHGKFEISDSEPILRVIDNRDQNWIIGQISSSLEFSSLDNSGNFPAITGAINMQSANVYGSLWDMVFYTNDDNINPNERMRINNVGNVGIGTTEPNSRLHVSSNGNNFITSENLNTNEGNYAGFKAKLGVNYWNSYIYSDGSFRINYNGAGADEFILKDNGSLYVANLGVGTNDPGNYKLSVKGKIGAEEIEVKQTIPDYVFEDDYNLRSLEEVESFILENKHLPDIPSAKVLEGKSVAVGKMQERHLQKIEELTLYIIEQNKKIKELSERMEKFEKSK